MVESEKEVRAASDETGRMRRIAIRTTAISRVRRRKGRRRHIARVRHSGAMKLVVNFELMEYTVKCDEGITRLKSVFLTHTLVLVLPTQGMKQYTLL